jgi:hypothetical protein
VQQPLDFPAIGFRIGSGNCFASDVARQLGQLQRPSSVFACHLTITFDRLVEGRYCSHQFPITQDPITENCPMRLGKELGMRNVK